jgi:hypothetical protein
LKGWHRTHPCYQVAESEKCTEAETDEEPSRSHLQPPRNMLFGEKRL